MKNFTLLLVVLLVNMTLANAQQRSVKKTVVTSENEIVNHVGKLITIQGVVSNSKIPMILGVDVADETPGYGGVLCEATGILEKTIIKEQKISKHSASRSTGTYYRLIDPETKQLAKPSPLQP